MIFFSLLIFILALSLPFFNTQITPIFFTRIAALVFIYAGVLSFNALYIQSIGSGIGIYSGLFQVTYYSLFIETFIYIVGAFILVSWPLIKRIANLYTENTKYHLTEGLSIQDSVSSLKNKPANLSGGVTLPSNLDLSGPVGLPLGSETYITTSIESKQYSLIALFSTLGGSFLLSSGDLLSMYLSIELQSFGLYILATIYRESGSATSAGLKYFLLGGLSSCLILLGGSLVYSFTGLTNFDSLYSLVSVLSISTESAMELASGGNSLTMEALSSIDRDLFIPFNSENISQGISLGLILIVVGFLFKIAAAPFHNWSPDVYDDSPTNVTIWLTIMPKLTIILFLLELEMGIALNLSQPFLDLTSSSLISGNFIDLAAASVHHGPDFFDFNIINGWRESSAVRSTPQPGYILKNIFLLSSLLSLIIGTVVGLAQIRIKRLLAYSTISHIGFLLLALAINTEQSTESLIFYLIQYTITNLNAFFILLAFGYILNSVISSSYINSDIKFIYHLKGQFLANPVLSLSLAICLFSMAGIPPLIGFFGKQSVLLSAIGNGYFFMAFVAIVVSVISASYYLRIIRDLHSEDNVSSNNAKSTVRSTSSLSMVPSPESSDLSDSFTGIDHKLEDREFVSQTEIANDLNKSLAFTLSPVGRKEQDSLQVGREEISLILNGKDEKLWFRDATYLTLTNLHAFVIATLTLSVLFFVLKPSILLNSTVLISLSLFNI
uniref:NADH dehydrogenase subunit 2 n=1 Tax=Ramaria rubella TaxID=113071 RepID=UPI0022376E23|nr:NADH dehydrogenase subunit 2 [Ramaria rubella]UYR22241.1 NADH dehydrogenase subunit 2 [Ramaria rubella]